MAAAEEQPPHGLVLDGELVVWDAEAGQLSFEALQRRAGVRARGAPALAAKWPAYFVAFDVLQMDGVELLQRPYAERRALLEQLFTDYGPMDAHADDDGPGQGTGVAGVLDRRVRGRGDRNQAPDQQLSLFVPRVDQGPPQGHHRSDHRRRHRHPDTTAAPRHGPVVGGVLVDAQVWRVGFEALA
ncbi:ATP-dependent DNA ligase [Streptomyces sp. NPDC004244]